MNNPTLTAEQLAQVDDWLDQLLTAEAADAEKALAACEDALVRAEVLSLLSYSRSDASQGNTFSLKVEQVAPDLLASRVDEETSEAWIGKVLGNYRLSKELGRGGMGVVFEGHRVAGEFDHRAAIKVLGPGAGTGSRDRFLQERQILARLDHPGIARFLDGGHADDGRPFFVLELVEGEPIDEFCRRLDLSVAATVSLFLKVCEAVDHAHQQMVVHRDIKPSNLLVVVQDGGDAPSQSALPQIKLLDFGIAKLAEPSKGQANLTVREQPLTPNYASPEQILGEPVAAATDVFALGTLLYQLLTGQLPNDRSKLTPTQLVAGARTTDAAPPSAKLREQAPQRLARTEISPDLDAIVLKAIRPDLEDRYQSVGSLARDLEAYLDGRPVAAVRGGRWYEFRRFVRRNRVPLAAAAAFVGLMAVGLILLTLQVQETERERNRAEATADFSLGILTLADVDQGFGSDFTALDMLNHATDSLAATENLPPDTRVEILRSLANGYGNLRNWEAAEGLLRQVLNENTAAPNAAHAMTLLDLAQTHAERRELAEAVTLLEKSQALYRDLSGADSLDYAQTLSSSVYFQWLGTTSESHDVMRALKDGARGIELFRAHNGAGSESEAALKLYLANHVGNALDQSLISEDELERMGLCTSVFDCLREALAIREQLGDDIATARTINDLALALDAAGEDEEATELLERALELHQNELGKAHPTSITILANLAGMHSELGQHQEAKRAYETAIELKTESDPLQENGFGGLWWGLGNAEAGLGNTDLTVELWTKAADQGRLSVPRRSHVAQSLGQLLARQGNLGEGQARLIESYQIQADHYGADDPRSRASAERVATLLRNMGDEQGALRFDQLALSAGANGASAAPVQAPSAQEDR